MPITSVTHYDALFEDLVWILWLVRTLWPWFCVGEPEIPKKGTEIIWTVLDTEFFLEEVLNLL